jgi:Uma2 family endonuclease
MTVQEYLEFERCATARHEYVNGEVLEMPGESPKHNRIAGNIYLKLELAFGERACEAFMENIRVRVSPSQYRYPDVVALCGKPQFDSDHPPSLLNPAVIFEVLSPSTEAFDQDEKFAEYQQIDDLTDYVLVAQYGRLVIHYVRQTPDHWTLTRYRDLSDTLTIATLEVTLALSDVYRKITF